MYKILIAENIPTLNKGELALLGGMLESFNLLDEYEVTIMSALPDIDSPRYENVKIVEADFLNIYGDILDYPKYAEILTATSFLVKHFLFLILYKMLNNNVLNIMKSSIWRVYLESDVIFIGHNGVFGLGSRLIPEKNLLTFFSYIFLPFFGKTLKKPLVIYAGSVPPFKQNRRFLWRWISFLLSRIDLITLRDEKSLENLKEMGYKSNRAFFTADIAFLLKADTKKALDIIKKEKIDINKHIIGVTVTKEIASKAYPDLGANNSYQKHIKLIADILDCLISETGATIVFLPHSIGFGENDDRIISNDIYHLCKNKNLIHVIKEEYKPNELKGIMNYFDFFIGERLHSVIGALSMETPSIVITYPNDQRIGIIDDLCKEDIIFYACDVDKDEFISKFLYLWGIKKEIKKELNIKMKYKKQKSLSNGKILKDIL
jgi:Uncharacterized conserved protein